MSVCLRPLDLSALADIGGGATSASDCISIKVHPSHLLCMERHGTQKEERPRAAKAMRIPPRRLQLAATLPPHCCAATEPKITGKGR